MKVTDSRQVAFLFKDIHEYLQLPPGYQYDSRLFYLMWYAFDFPVSEQTLKRYYYMSKSERELIG